MAVADASLEMLPAQLRQCSLADTRRELSREQRDAASIAIRFRNLNTHTSLRIETSVLLSAQYTSDNLVALLLRFAYTPRGQQLSNTFALVVGVYTTDVQVPALSAMACPVLFRICDCGIEEGSARRISRAIGEER